MEKFSVLHSIQRDFKAVFIRFMFLTRALVGVAFQHCNFFFNFSKNIFGKKLKKTFFHLFYSNFFNIISEKKVNIFCCFCSLTYRQ